MLQQAVDFQAEADDLNTLLTGLSELDWDRPTLFKGWTVNDIVGHLHEGDLMRLFRALSAQQPGLFALNGCSLDRSGRMGAPLPKQANLTAECELSWLTVDPKADKS